MFCVAPGFSSGPSRYHIVAFLLMERGVRWKLGFSSYTITRSLKSWLRRTPFISGPGNIYPEVNLLYLAVVSFFAASTGGKTPWCLPLRLHFLPWENQGCAFPRRQPAAPKSCYSAEERPSWSSRRPSQPLPKDAAQSPARAQLDLQPLLSPRHDKGKVMRRGIPLAGKHWSWVVPELGTELPSLFLSPDADVAFDFFATCFGCCC